MGKSKILMKGGRGFFSWLKGLFTRKRNYAEAVRNEKGWFYAGGSRKKRYNRKTRKLRRN